LDVKADVAMPVALIDSVTVVVERRRVLYSVAVEFLSEETCREGVCGGGGGEGGG
jgi:hypothetical protein